MYNSTSTIVHDASTSTIIVRSHLSLPVHHWKALMKIMHRAETCFEQLLDHQVISHIHHAKRLVPYRTMTSPSTKSPLKYFGGLAYGCNVFLPCHTDDDFTMSIVQIFLKDHTRCQIGDDIVTHFCFQPWVSLFLCVLVIFSCSMHSSHIAFHLDANRVIM